MPGARAVNVEDHLGTLPLRVVPQVPGKGEICRTQAVQLASNQTVSAPETTEKAAQVCRGGWAGQVGGWAGSVELKDTTASVLSRL